VGLVCRSKTGKMCRSENGGKQSGQHKGGGELGDGRSPVEATDVIYKLYMKSGDYDQHEMGALRVGARVPV